MHLALFPNLKNSLPKYVSINMITKRPKKTTFDIGLNGFYFNDLPFFV